jgi:hypothetical protein
MVTLSRTFSHRVNTLRDIGADVADWLTTHVGPARIHAVCDAEWTYNELGGKYEPTKYMNYKCGTGWIMILGDVITRMETPNSIRHAIIQELLVSVDDENAALHLKLAYF